MIAVTSDYQLSLSASSFFILLLSVPSLFIYLLPPQLSSPPSSVLSTLLYSPTPPSFSSFFPANLHNAFTLPFLLPSLCPMHSTGQPACFCHLMTRTCWGHSHGVQHLEDVLIERKNNAPQVR